MALMTYLHRDPRTGIYYHRRAVPAELRGAVGKREIKRSLGTKDHKEAKRLNQEAGVEVESLLRSAQDSLEGLPVLDDAEADRLAAQWLSDALEEDEDYRREGLSERDYLKLGEALDFVDAGGRANFARGNTELVEFEVDEIIDRHGLGVAKGSEGYRKLAYAVMKASVRANEMMRARQEGQVVDTPPAPPPATTTSVTPSAPPQGASTDQEGIRLTVLLDAWLFERKPSAKTEQEWRTGFRRLREVIGCDVPARAVTKDHIRAFKDALMRCPANMKASLRRKPLPKVIELTKSDTTTPRLSRAAVNKSIGAVASVFSWAVANGYLDTNVASGMKVKSRGEDQEKRLSYSLNDLKVIFEQSPVFREGARPRAGGGDAAYWLPLLALFTGARLEELGQALVRDIKEDAGITYLDINTLDEGKSLKTKVSRRMVPLHPELVRCGFLDYVAERRRKQGAHLFPDLKPDTKGARTGNWSKWWGRYARQSGVTDRLKVFHSFRHTFKDACRAAGIEEAVFDALQGHTSATVSRSYGAGYPLSVLAAAVERVEYPGLALAHLHR